MSTSLHVLTKAIADRLPAVIRVGGPAARDLAQVCFLADGRPDGHAGIWTEIVEGDLGQLDRLIAAQAHAEVSFTAGEARFSFETVPLRQQRAFLRGQRLLIAWPSQLRIRERRASERERVPQDGDISARLYLPPDGRQEIPLYVWDLSRTGVALLWPPGKRPPRFEPGQNLRLALRIDGVDHTFAVTFRNTQTLPGGRVRLGVEFVAADANPETLNQIGQLVADLKSRRIRSSLGSALIKGVA